MYKKIEEAINKKIYGKVLCISGYDYIFPLINENSEIFDAQFPEVDMQKMPYKENYFDYIISDQVIEHLENPQEAIDESYRVLKNGGIAIHTSCFINYIHYGPEDFWRFSPDALKLLCKKFSKIICFGGWGNRLAIILCLLSDKFRNMIIPEKKWCVRNFIGTWNEERYPIVTWIVAQK